MKSKFNIPAGVAVFALLALSGLMGLFALNDAQSAEAQEEGTTVEYAENGSDRVANFTAVDPEGIQSITWAVLADDAAFADIEGVADADAADAADFMIDKDGMLRFAIGENDDPPDFENPMGSNSDNTACDVAATPNPCTNTYRVVVSATAGGRTGYKKVTVTVTNVAERGEVTWTTDANADSTVDDPKLVQFQPGTLLTASVTDGDIAGPDKAAASPTWRWYSSPGRTATGTMIDGENSATHTVTTADVGMYLRAEAYYVVTGNIDQETASLTSGHPVLAVRAGNNQLRFDPAEISRETPEGRKDMRVGAPVTATGNHGAVSYTLAGDDAGKFRIDQRTGQITTMVNLDFDETDTRRADQCANRNSCVVTVRATDASGDATAVSEGDNVFPDATVTIELTDVNEKPEFISDYNAVSPMTITRAEGMTALADTDAAVTYTAMDPEGRNITYRLMGPDGDNFSLSSDRVLSFKQKTDFEMPMDTGRNNLYEVTVRASDSTLHEDRIVKVHVTNVDDAPAVSGPSSRNFKENGEAPVATFTATDPEGVTSITWSLPDVAPGTLPDGFAAMDFTGSDAAHFTIDRDGMLRFAIGDDEDPPDFEAPRGAAFNAATNSNTYKVVVAASDQETGGMMGYHKITVMVTDVVEKGEVTWTTDANADSTVDDPMLVQFQAGTLLTASVTDGDIGGPDKAVDNPAWRWYRRSALISGEETNAYTVTTDDVGRHIRVEATYRVGDSTTQETASLTSSHPVLAIQAGNNQLRFDPATASREVPEGRKGAKVGAPVTATDNHGSVNYTLTGDDAEKFRIDQRTGQITTDVDLDFDAADAALPDNCRDENGCSVTVRATDASGDTTAANATVTIRLTDVNEKPKFISDSSAASPTTITRAEGMTALADNDADVTYTAMDPEKLNVNLSLMGSDEDRFSLSLRSRALLQAEDRLRDADGHGRGQRVRGDGEGLRQHAARGPRGQSHRYQRRRRAGDHGGQPGDIRIVQRLTRRGQHDHRRALHGLRPPVGHRQVETGRRRRHALQGGQHPGRNDGADVQEHPGLREAAGHGDEQHQQEHLHGHHQGRGREQQPKGHDGGHRHGHQRGRGRDGKPARHHPSGRRRADRPPDGPGLSGRRHRRNLAVVQVQDQGQRLRGHRRRHDELHAGGDGRGQLPDGQGRLHRRPRPRQERDGNDG